MDNFIRGLLTVLLWFFTLGGMFCAAIIIVVGCFAKASWTWLAIIPFAIFVVGEIIAFKFRSKE